MQIAPYNHIAATDNDVLGGRGKQFDNRPGNRWLTDLVHAKFRVHHFGSPQERREIVDEIEELFHLEGRRAFKLEYDRLVDLWIWVEEPNLRGKIGQKLRDAYKYSERTANRLDFDRIFVDALIHL